MGDLVRVRGKSAARDCRVIAVTDDDRSGAPRCECPRRSALCAASTVGNDLLVSDLAVARASSGGGVEGCHGGELKGVVGSGATSVARKTATAIGTWSI